jgi:hypothetical protein
MHNDTEEVFDWRPVDAYQAKRQEDLQMMVFNDLSATCERMMPLTGELQAGMRFAVSDGQKPARVLVELVPGKKGLYFTVLASRDENIPCKSNSPMTVSVESVYMGNKPKKTPPLPKNQEEWDRLEGEGTSVLRFWYLLWQFKEYSKGKLKRPKHLS